MLELAKQEVRSIQHSKIRDVAVSVKNEVLEMIAKVAGRAKGQTGLADCQWKTPKKNIRQNRLAVSRQCREIYHHKKDKQL